MKNIIDIYEASILADVEDTLNDKTIFKRAEDQCDWI